MNSKWLSTNELRIIDIDKITNYKNIKPKKNPIHSNFVDNIFDVFKKFNFEENNFFGKGGFNKIYKNKRFILRITKKILYVNDIEQKSIENIEDLKNFNEKDKYINIETQKLSEQILIKAIKNNLSPRVYFFGNIYINEFIHRYMIMEAYTMSLDIFFKNHEFLNIQNKYGYYKDYGDLLDNIGNKLIEIHEKLIEINYIFYDIKPDNIVIHVNSDGKIDLKLIDWDCEYIDVITWINNYKNKKCIIFLNLLIVSYFVNIFYNKKFLKNILKNMYYPKIMDDLIEILDYLPKYNFVLKHYFLNDKDKIIKNEKYLNEISITKLLKIMFNRCL